MSKDIIAVVTPVYNGGGIIEMALKSLIRQSVSNWISIIVDDGSTDNTAEILSKYKSDRRFFIIHLKKNVGRGAARKIALEKVKEVGAKYMCMLDADDLYYPDKLEWQFNYMERNSDITLASCSMGYIDRDFSLIGILESFRSEQIFRFSNYLDYVEVPHACSIIRVADIGSNTFDEKLLLGQDQDFMIRLLKNRNYSFIPKIGYLYSRNDSFSFKKYRRTLYLSYYAKQKLGIDGISLFKLKLGINLKIILVGMLCLINRQDLYLKNIGRSPRHEELHRHIASVEFLFS